VVVPPLGEAIDGVGETLDAVEAATVHSLAGEDAEPGFDLVHPRSAGGREVKREALVPREQTRPQRQHRLGAIQRLHLRLLVHRQHDRSLRRIEVEADRVGGLRRQLRIVWAWNRTSGVPAERSRR